MLKIVLDANIFVSAVLKPHSGLTKIFELVKEDKIKLILSDDILSEIRAVFFYPKIKKRHKQTSKKIEEFLRNAARTSILTQGKIKIDQIKEDLSNNIYLSAEVEGKADFIISGDHHLRDLKSFHGIRILDPSTFLNLMARSTEK
jgi:putative PIN family toxin of toxin-antitoxin system